MSFEFGREGLVWLEDTTVSPSVYYRLHTTREVTFTQTFRQSSIPQRTLHSPKNLFQESSITKANPANFSFSIFVVDETSTHQHKPLDFLLNYSGNTLNTFNLYFVYLDYSPEVYYKIEKCVFTQGSFNIPRKGIMQVDLSGTGSKLTRTEGTFPGTDSNFDSDPSIAVSRDIKITVGSDVLDNILGVSLEVQNSISWTENNTVQKSLAVTSASNTTFPENFVLNQRTLAGSVSQYINSDVNSSNENLQTWQEDTTVRIQAGLSASNYQLDLNMPNACSFTNRTTFGSLFTQNYDYRLMANPSDLSTYFTY